jgi:hypothetical protein
MTPERFKRGIAAAAKVFSSKSRAYTVNDSQLSCPVCSSKTFEHRRVLLNTAAASLVNLDWANASASALICDSCTHITWFLTEPTRIL